MRNMVLCATLVAALSPLSVGAQPLPLTEADALGRLSDESPRVRALRAGIDIARADVLAAGRWPNPRVTFDRESVAGIAENITMVNQALPITGRRGLEMQTASALVEATAGRADDGIRRARADLRLAFALLVAAQARERELTESRGRLADLAETLAKREAAGDVAGFDRLRAERELQDLEADLGTARVNRARAQAMLAEFFPGPVDVATVVAVAPAATRTNLPTIDALITRAESTRGELLALVKEAEAARLAERVADRRRVPEPELTAGTKTSTAGTGDLGGVLAIHVTVPLFDRSRAERAAAEARGNQAVARAEVFRASLRTEIAALVTAVTERRQVADRYRSAAVGSADQMQRIAQVSYDAGDRSILELLDAYRAAASTRLRQAELDAAVRQAEIELEFVSGWEMP